jgi:uncharacterized protein YlxP (DUF503 family)
MHTAALRVELRLPDVHSLKEKRHRMSMLTTDLRKAFPSAGVSEVGFQEQWQRTTFGVAIVTSEASHLQRLISGVRRFYEDRPDAELLEVDVSFLERA